MIFEPLEHDDDREEVHKVKYTERTYEGISKLNNGKLTYTREIDICTLIMKNVALQSFPIVRNRYSENCRVAKC